MELQAARESVRSLPKSENLTIEIKASQWSDTVADMVVRDEYGFPSSAAPWVPVPLTQTLLRERGLSQLYCTEYLGDPADMKCPPDFSRVELDFGRILRSLRT
jgi:hypothetical protein